MKLIARARAKESLQRTVGETREQGGPQFFDIVVTGNVLPGGDTGRPLGSVFLCSLPIGDVVKKVRRTLRPGLASWSANKCRIASRTSGELRVTDPDYRVSLI
ncbi:hypothetical protein [Bradyrhizobium pachyrhizi]|uniref:hypothetical protein n=1 Tax=Bradyrhizobium pachyrhizi TaxID=280333 RepID=UPI000A626906|nr:hypothetical protein [Bradyrhizobium pachyrhizi]